MAALVASHKPFRELPAIVQQRQRFEHLATAALNHPNDEARNQDSTHAVHRLYALQSYNEQQKRAAFLNLGAAVPSFISPRNWNTNSDLGPAIASNKIVCNLQQFSGADENCRMPCAVALAATETLSSLSTLSSRKCQRESQAKPDMSGQNAVTDTSPLMTSRTLDARMFARKALQITDDSIRSGNFSIDWNSPQTPTSVQKHTAVLMTNANRRLPPITPAVHHKEHSLAIAKSRMDTVSTRKNPLQGSKSDPRQRCPEPCSVWGQTEGTLMVDCCVQTTDPKLECCVCQDQYPEQTGVVCSRETSGHFYCDECFSDSVNVQVTGEDKLKFLETGCEVACAFCGPDGTRSVFEMRQCMSHLRPDAYAAFLSASAEPHVIQAQKQLQAQLAAKEAELHEQMKKQSDDAMLNMHLHHIAENLVLPRCPRCRDPVIDFSNCTHLTVRLHLSVFKLTSDTSISSIHPTLTHHTSFRSAATVQKGPSLAEKLALQNWVAAERICVHGACNNLKTPAAVHVTSGNAL
jgi:hypothetical protein